MLQQIYRGTVSNDKTGTPAKTGAQIINDNFAYLDNKITRKDGIVVSTGSTTLGQDITYNAFWQWIIDTINYTNPEAVVLNFPYTVTAGFSRLDMVALTTSNTFIRIPGTESASNPVSPPLPDNMVQVGFVLVTDASVSEPTPPVVGDIYVKKAESQDFVADYGATTVIDQIDLVDDRNSISLIGSATDVKSVQLSGEFIRPGKPHFFKNRTGHDVTLWHLAGTGNIKYFFPNSQNLIIKPNEVYFFDTNANDSSNVMFEYVGNFADLTDYYTKSEIDSKLNEELAFALSDETSNLTVGNLITFRMPFAMTLTSVRISVNTAPTISSIIVDAKESGVSIFSTLLSIDATEKTSVTAATPAVISDVNLADDAEITVSTTQIGSGVAGAGLKIIFIGNKV